MSRDKNETLLQSLFEGNDALLNAVTYQAMKDYVKCIKIKNNVEIEIDELKTYFVVNCETVTGLDGELLLNKMNKYLKEEGYKL